MIRLVLHLSLKAVRQTSKWFLGQLSEAAAAAAAKATSIAVLSKHG